MKSESTKLTLAGQSLYYKSLCIAGQVNDNAKLKKGIDTERQTAIYIFELFPNMRLQ